MDLGLRGQTALVLAAGGGLGSAIAELLAREGANVAVAGRHAEVDRPDGKGGRGRRCARAPLVWDLADLTLIDSHVSTIERELGPVDILVNITGGPPPTPAAGQAADLWAAQFNAMVLPVIATTDRVLPAMRQRKLGPHRHRHILGRPRAHPKSRNLQHAPPVAARLVEDARHRGRRRRRHMQHRGAGPHRDGPGQVPGRGQRPAAEPRRAGGRGSEPPDHPAALGQPGRRVLDHRARSRAPAGRFGENLRTSGVDLRNALLGAAGGWGRRCSR